LRVLDFPEAKMSPKINRREQTEEFECIHSSDNAHVKFAIVEPSVRSDPHSTAIRGRIGDGGENSRLEFVRGAVIVGNFHGKRKEAKELPWRAKSVSTMRADPFRKLVSAPSYLSIEANAGNTTEVV